MASHDQVAHNWAHQTGRARRGFNMYYEGETIYSYGSHFPIAKFVQAPNGERVILFNADGYSVSTAKHKTIVWRALGYGRPDVIEVPDLASFNVNGKAKGTIETLMARLPGLLLKWKRARTYKDTHARTIRATVETANRLAELWELPERFEVPEDFEQYAAEYERAERERQKERDRKEREAIREWVAGADIRPPNTRVPYVRVMAGQVETSWGIRVPLRDALALYHLARLCRKCGHAFRPSKRHLVGTWGLDKVEADGTIRAGCHVIPFRVSQEAAKMAGLARA